LLTLATLLHPEWGLALQPYDVAEALGQALLETDPLRVALLADRVYDPVESALRAPQDLSAAHRGRLGPALLNAYQSFWRRWQEVLPAAGLPWEHVLSRLLGQVLSDAVLDPSVATACTELLESARRFRQVFPILHEQEDPTAVGRYYLEMLRSGLVTAQYAVDTEERAPAVLVAPVHSYLLAGSPVRRQFWLDLGSVDWWTPPQQPLTNPYVLSRRWPAKARWNDAADYGTRQATLARLIQGLCRRCREGIVLCSSQLSTVGQPCDGPLLRALEPILLRWSEGGN
jgi:hypothetical protein